MSEKKKGLSGVLATIETYAASIGKTVGIVSTTIGQTIGVVKSGQMQPTAAPPLEPSASSSGSPPPNPSAANSAVQKAEGFAWKLGVAVLGVFLVVVVFLSGLFGRRR